MADEDDMWEKTGYLSPKEVQSWALQEQRDSAKAHELRVKSATEIATAYAKGELTPEQAQERMFEHDHRWGEALPGTHAFPASTDEHILASIDKVRGKYVSARDLESGFRERFGKKEERGGPPSR
jgi:hypothetical protein